MIAAAVRADPPLSVCIIKRENCVGRTSQFEGTDTLQVLALDEQLATGQIVQRLARHDGRTMDSLTDSIVSRSDDLDGRH
jgi:hypothetical protein